MIKIIDTHLHIWDRENLHLPWLDGDTSILSENYSLDDYITSLNGENLYEISKAIYMEVDVCADDRVKENEYIIKVCNDKDTIVSAVIISGDLTSNDFSSYISNYAKIDTVKGVRHVLHTPANPPKTCLGDKFIENVRILGDNNLIFEGCVRACELPDLYSLALLCPNTTIVLNHMGIIDPDIISKENPNEEEKAYKDEWINNLKKLASLPNIICKVSGLNPASSWNIETLREPVNIVIDIFGEDRIVFGSNYPVCNISTCVDPWIRALIEITKVRGEEFTEKFFFRNALINYKL